MWTVEQIDEGENKYVASDLGVETVPDVAFCRFADKKVHVNWEVCNKIWLNWALNAWCSVGRMLGIGITVFKAEPLFM